MCLLSVQHCGLGGPPSIPASAQQPSSPQGTPGPVSPRQSSVLFLATNTLGTCATLAQYSVAFEGAELGIALGMLLGTADGGALGTSLGTSDGDNDGICDVDGIADGALDGKTLGALLGETLGVVEGAALGEADGSRDGSLDGVIDGEGDGAIDGIAEGDSEGRSTQVLPEGPFVGMHVIKGPHAQPPFILPQQSESASQDSPRNDKLVLLQKDRMSVGLAEGNKDGAELASTVGLSLGDADGVAVGAAVGRDDGRDVGVPGMRPLHSHCMET